MTNENMEIDKEKIFVMGSNENTEELSEALLAKGLKPVTFQAKFSEKAIKKYGIGGLVVNYKGKEYGPFLDEVHTFFLGSYSRKDLNIYIVDRENNRKRLELSPFYIRLKSSIQFDLAIQKLHNYWNLGLFVPRCLFFVMTHFFARMFRTKRGDMPYPMMNLMASSSSEGSGGSNRPGNPNVEVGDDEDG